MFDEPINGRLAGGIAARVGNEVAALEGDESLWLERGL